MKLAEALIARADYQKRNEQLKKRISLNLKSKRANCLRKIRMRCWRSSMQYERNDDVDTADQ